MVTWLSATAHEGKYTYSHILEITHGLRPLEKIVLSPEFDVLKIALAPPLLCKSKHKNEVLCKHKGYLFFLLGSYKK